jgi:lipopolysaccharide/colanic/teichoic acid biosynthesis glycosyltransferase
MSSFEPRPERLMGVIMLASQIPRCYESHMVRAGLTGWVQINDTYGTRIDDARSRMSDDVNNARSFLILFDPVILPQTPCVMSGPSGVR